MNTINTINTKYKKITFRTIYRQGLLGLFTKIIDYINRCELPLNNIFKVYFWYFNYNF